MATQRDPVCGMEVDDQNAAGSAEHEGQRYSFCSDSCLKQFEQNPERFTSAPAGSREVH